MYNGWVSKKESPGCVESPRKIQPAQEGRSDTRKKKFDEEIVMWAKYRKKERVKKRSVSSKQ